jgi:hypothetical protein
LKTLDLRRSSLTDTIGNPLPIGYCWAFSKVREHSLQPMNKKNPLRTVVANRALPYTSLWTLHFLGLIVAAFWLSWWMLTPLDFGFRIGYRLLDIDAHIQEFGPQNQYRDGYEKTSDAQRFAHFAAIAQAINDGGKGLADITYDNGTGKPSTLLRDAEITHLQDVAALVSLFHVAGPILLLAWLLTGVVAKRQRWQMPEAKALLAGTGVLLGLCAAILLLAGPTNVFYWLHTHIFPENHQWFFYYQESLMTTLMKAPDLFGFIAALWAICAITLIAITVVLERRWLH